MLESSELRQLKQRIGVRWRLRPLSPSETREYVRHRLRIAAGAARELFSPAALRELHRLSGGIPRVVNVLSDRALLAGYAAGIREVRPALVRAAAAEVRGHGGGGWLRRKLARPALLDVSLAAALIVCAGLWLWLSRMPQVPAPIASSSSVDVAAPPPVAPSASGEDSAALPEPEPDEAPAAEGPRPLGPPEAAPATLMPMPAKPVSSSDAVRRLETGVEIA